MLVPALQETNPEGAHFFLRLGQKLGSVLLRSDQDIARLVDQRLPLTSLDALMSHGVTDEEIFSYVLPRRTLAHRRSRKEPLTHEESDRAVRIARITALAEEVFGDDTAAGHWLRPPSHLPDPPPGYDAS